ncbi:glycosyl transferase family 25 [Anaeromyxobacter dehalogenans 2CP-1]|uniref:Glycosyl transferase family 25 n=1 Tax=Anaeromyxobacter dehalogenans (strain ATCC BAA-258 / DSM 21875 / 2CP-1) TaxID=455488 RepID=B8JAL1_ANAD2|nr:glycosyltransferase family 25 protein [Anaeromyxobacter dehalogenans]ACL67510.1 glycosyl transferase family 25 [Anaeromyxobacter dehalogenans 2CP-1]
MASGVGAPAPAPLAPAVAAAWDALHRAFDRIFVITIERAAERQERVRTRLTGLDYRFHLGMDKRLLDPARRAAEGYDEAADRAAARRSRTMTPGELACAISHLQIYRAAVEHGWERVLVFEDDVLPRYEDLALLPQTLEQLPDDWELAYLGYTNFEKVTPYHRAKQATYLVAAALGLMKWTPAEIRRFHPRRFSENLKVAGLHHCAHAYAFTQAAARKLVAAQTPLARNADQLFVHMVLSGKLRAFVTEPKFFDQEAGSGKAADYSFIFHD